jgi:hypothetical protein
LKQQKLIELSNDQMAAVAAGFQSDALGSTHTYLCGPQDQQLLQSAINTAKLTELPDGWSYPLCCEDSQSEWAWIEHTAEQILQVAQAGICAPCCLWNGKRIACQSSG